MTLFSADKLTLFAQPGCEQIAAGTAHALGISVVLKLEQIATDYYLDCGDGGLSLVKNPGSDRVKTASRVAISCDFVTGASRHRRLYGGGIRQALGRAVGLSGNFKPLVADLTAGLGRDSFVLASLGARVILIERNSIVSALLADGLDRLRQRATQDAVLADISDRLTLCKADAKNWLSDFDEHDRPDAIYLDPMFPERAKSANVKKEMAIFHDVVGDDADADTLLEAALEVAHYRVVVKRPRRAPPLADRTPGFSIDGKTTRFDIYPLKKIPR